MRTKLFATFILICISMSTYAFRLNKGKLFTVQVNSGYALMEKEKGGLTKTTDSYANGMSSAFVWGGGFYIQPLRRFGLGVLYSKSISNGSHAEGSDHVTTEYIAPQMFFPIVQTDK